MIWWAELRAGIGETRLIAAIGGRATGAGNVILQGYFESAESQRFSRTVKSYDDCREVRFRSPAEERAIHRTAQCD